ncbi:uncharacterized protein LOC144119644 [Amblyomma americanum]
MRWRWSGYDKPEPHERQTSGLLSYLLPFYLCPVLYPGTKESKCFYCVLLMMCWWQLRAMPKAVLAFLPAVALPLLGIMGHEQVASNYFSVDVLTAVLLLWLVLAGDETATVGRLSYALVGHFGGRVRPLLVLLTAATFVASLVLPQSLVAVVVTCLVERVCKFVRDEGLQDTQRCLERHAAEEAAGRSRQVDTLILYEELALALWKRHRAGLVDRDSIECWDDDDERHGGAESPDAKSSRASALKQKASILKSASKAALLNADPLGALTPTGPRFADNPADEKVPLAEGSKPPEGKLIRAKRRRQSFADKPLVFEYSERRRMQPDMPPPPSRIAPLAPPTEEPTSSRSTFARAAHSSASVTSGEAATGKHVGPGTGVSVEPIVVGVGAGANFGVCRIDSPSEFSGQASTPRPPGSQQHLQRRVSMAAGLAPDPTSDTGGPRLQGRRFSIRYPNQPSVPGAGSPKHHTAAGQRFRAEERSSISNALSSFISAAPGDEDNEDHEEKRLRRSEDFLAALCVCGNMTSVAGSIASYWFTPAAEAIAANMGSTSLSFWSWMLITLPASLAASALSSVCVYYGSLQAHENHFSAQSEDVVRSYAKLKLSQLKRYEHFERLILLSWAGYSGIILWCRYIHRQDLPTCFLGGIVLLASTALTGLSGARPASKTTPKQFLANVDVDGDEAPDFGRDRAASGIAALTTRLPWSVIVIYGAASVITRVAQTTGMAKVAFSPQFWSQQSDLAKQVLLTVVSSVMAEFMNAAALCDAILPMVANLCVPNTACPVHEA